MAKKEAKQTTIFAGQLTAGQQLLCEDGKFRRVTRVDAVVDPSKPNMLANEVIAYVDHGGEVKPILCTTSAVIKSA